MMRKCGLVAACALVFLVLAAGVAAAHVTVSPSSLPQGTDDAILTFRVPNESDTAAVTGLKIRVPPRHPIVLLNPQSGSGWQVNVVKTSLPKPDHDRRRHLHLDRERDRLVRQHYRRRTVRRIQRVGPRNPDGHVRTRVQGDPDVQRRHRGVVDPGPQQGRPRSEHPAPIITLTSGSGGPRRRSRPRRSQQRRRRPAPHPLGPTPGRLRR